MNAVKRQRPSISQDDVDRLLFYLEDARDFVIKYSSAQDFHSPEKATAERVVYAVDELALQITGNNRYYWAPHVSAFGDERQAQKSNDKWAKRKRLLGIHFPIRAIKVPGGLTNGGAADQSDKDGTARHDPPDDLPVRPVSP